MTYLLVLARGARFFARYLALLAPFTALYAGVAAVAVAHWFTSRRRGLAAAAAVLAIGATGALQTLRYDLFLAREDTRWLAGAWIADHVPPGTALTLPNVMWSANPVVPPDPAYMNLAYGREIARLLAPRMAGVWSPYATDYLAVFLKPAAGWRPRGFVVTAEHPAVSRHLNVSPRILAALRAARARPVVTFEGGPAVLPPGVVFDPPEAEYVPLTGFELLQRPGPNLTIWAVPPPYAAKPP
jgi:hypothetical protein